MSFKEFRAELERLQTADASYEQAEKAYRHFRKQIIDEVIAEFLRHHAVTQDQADFANAILRSVRALSNFPVSEVRES